MPVGPLDSPGQMEWVAGLEGPVSAGDTDWGVIG